MFKSEENQVIKATEPLGLKVAKELPQRLKLEKSVELSGANIGKILISFDTQQSEQPLP
jgi:hypothetical protein